MARSWEPRRKPSGSWPASVSWFISFHKKLASKLPLTRAPIKKAETCSGLLLRAFTCTLLPEPTELQKCVFAESLVTAAEDGADPGTFRVTVQFANRVLRPCMMLQAQSRGAPDGSPSGAAVTGEGRQRPFLKDDLHSSTLLVYNFSFSSWKCKSS